MSLQSSLTKLFLKKSGKLPPILLRYLLELLLACANWLEGAGRDGEV